jgi:hypothetical protein
LFAIPEATSWWISATYQDTHPTFEFLLSMANTTASSLVPTEKELSSSTQSQAYEDEETLELSSTSVDQNDKRKLVALDNAGTAKSTQDPGSPPLGTRDGGDGAELPPEPAVEHPGLAREDYSILTVAQKRAVVLTASFASLFSPMATAIYCVCSGFCCR